MGCSMEEQCMYEIELEVPIGVRQGMLYLHIREKQISGKISVLGSVESFSGKVKEQEEIEVEGELRSAYRKIHYHGSGKRTEDMLEMALAGSFGTYRLRGKYLCGVTAE